MKTITVLFVGLIAHVNQPGSLDNTAVMLIAPSHEAKVLVPVEATPVDPDDDWLFTHPRPNDVYDRYEIKVTGWTIRLSGTRGMFCDHPQDVLDHVPRLQSLTPKCRRLKQEVRDRKPGGPFASFFDYRGGRLYIADYLQMKLKYTPTDGGKVDERCASCRLRYDADLTGDYAYLTFKKGSEVHTIRVPSNTVIEVDNFPKTKTNGHFDMFFEVFENCSSNVDVEQSTSACDKKRICNPGMPPFPFGDCTNSQYP